LLTNKGQPRPPQKDFEKFECEVRLRDHPEELKRLSVEASTRDDCVRRLIDQGYLVVSVKRPGQADLENAAKIFAVTAGFKKAKSGEGYKPRSTLFSFTKRVTTRELIFFAVQLSTLLRAGIPLIRSLEIIRKGTPNPDFRTVIQALSGSVSGGTPFGVALRNQKGTFPWIWANLVDVGEATGKLPECLEEIGKYQEAAARVRGKILTAFFYPGVLTCAVIGAMAFLLIFIVPKFAVIFEQQKMQLPALTRAVIQISDLVRHQAYLFLLLFVPVIVIAYIIKNSYTARVSFDLFRLRMPVFGELLIQIAVIRFSRALSTLLKSGVSILQGLDIGGRLVENAYLEAGIRQVAKSVRSGQGLGAQLEARKLFPVFMTQLITVGEETGQIDKFLDLLATFYEERVDTFLTRLTTLLEPIMLVVMGGVIGTVVISMFLPIIELSTRAGLGGG